jgi:predicted transcriptional regulator of viral defense system
MALYFSVDAVALAERNLYLRRLEDTHLTRQIGSIIEEFREELPRQRAPRMFPH